MGKTRSEMGEMLASTMPHLPEEKPVHLLGIGDLESLQLCIPLGIDTFDSSYPTRAARHGLLLTHAGNLNLTKGENARNFGPPAPGCQCPTCQRFSLAYLHHLFKAREVTALTLATVHNLYFMVELMQRYRASILNDQI